MSQPPSYEFEEDDAPKPERKKFIPGLEPAASAAPLAPTPAAPGAPPTAPVRKAPAPAPKAAKSPGAAQAPAPVSSEPDNPDLKPGSRKDLWNCPHCGTGNKPERTTCRACGKSPSDAKETPLWKKPKVIAAVVGVLVLLVVIVVLLRPSLELKPPGASSVDRGIRRGSAQTIECDLVGKTFIPKGRLSVTGRICASRPLSAVDGVISVVLLLGAGAADDGLAAANITYNNQVIENIPPGAVVLHLITKEKIDVTKGAYLSVLGDYGQLAEGSLIVSATEQGDVVAVDQLRQ